MLQTDDAVARARAQEMAEENLEVKLPTMWTHDKHRLEESEKRREEERRSDKRKSQKKLAPGARKIANHQVFSNDLWVEKQAR